jgi:hypothetical protein
VTQNEVDREIDRRRLSLDNLKMDFGMPCSSEIRRVTHRKQTDRRYNTTRNRFGASQLTIGRSYSQIEQASIETERCLQRLCKQSQRKRKRRNEYQSVQRRAGSKVLVEKCEMLDRQLQLTLKLSQPYGAG